MEWEKAATQLTMEVWDQPENQIIVVVVRVYKEVTWEVKED